MKNLLNFINNKILKNKKLLLVCATFAFLFLCLPATAHAHGEGGIIIMFGGLVFCVIALIFTIICSFSSSQGILKTMLALNIIFVCVLGGILFFYWASYPEDLDGLLLFCIIIPLGWFLFNIYFLILLSDINLSDKTKNTISFGIPIIAIFLYFLPFLLTGLEEIYYSKLSSKLSFLSKINFTSPSKNERLISAIEKNDFEAVNKFISKNADVILDKKQGKTPLAYAVSANNIEMAKYLLSKGADVNKKDIFEKTPIFYVKDIEMAKLLIDKGAELNPKKLFDQSLLFELTIKHPVSEELLEFIIDKGADVNICKNIPNCSFVELVRQGNKEKAAFLLSKGANINMTGVNEIFCSISSERNPSKREKEMIKWLVSNGINIDKQCEDETFSALHKANEEISEILLANGANPNIEDVDGQTPLDYALKHWSRDREKVELLVNNGANVNAKNDFGETPLHQISKQWLIPKEAAEFLISTGADINARNNNNETPLHYAVQNRNESIIEFLIAKGALINAKDKQGKTPLHYAATSTTDKSFVEILLANGADMNLKDNEGKTALDYARSKDIKQVFLTYKISLDNSDNKDTAELSKKENINTNDISDELSKKLFEQVKKGNFEEVKNLVNQGASLVERFKDEDSYYGKFYGVTSIEKAVELNNLDMVNFFLDYGADIRTGNIRPSLLHFAPSKEMAELLVKRGVDVNAEDNNGTTALAVAVAKDYYDVAKFLIEKGANVNKADEADFTPLCSAKSKKMAELLLDNGADINSIGEGGTPLDSARNEEIRQFLISRGAKSAKDLE